MASPKDRFLRGNRRDARRSKVETQRRSDEKRAEERAGQNEEYICKQCRLWHPLSDFEYVYKDDTMIATRCSYCRSEQRRKYARQGRRTRG